MLKKMELAAGTDVYTATGQKVGKINRFIVDPATKEVTHVVVQKGWLLSEDKVLALQMVSSATEDGVVLTSDANNFDRLPPFEEKYFIQTPDEDLGESGYLIGDRTSESSPTYYWYPPQVSPGYPAFTLDSFSSSFVERKRNIPEETIPLKDGSNVISSDGKHVGNIERLFIEPGVNRATHLVIKHGVLFKERKLIPTQWVKSIEEDKVYLLISSQLLNKLPAYEQ